MVHPSSIPAPSLPHLQSLHTGTHSPAPEQHPKPPALTLGNEWSETRSCSSAKRAHTTLPPHRSTL